MGAGGIELLNPKGLWLLTALVPLVVLYILKVRRQRMRVGSTWLWAAAHRDLMAKQPFRKLVAELPLILQIIALIALSIAFARPAARGGTITGDHVALVIDTSASMGTSTPDGKTRMALAQGAARDAVGALEPGADAIVIEAAREAKIVSPKERDRRRLAAAVMQLSARDVEGDLAPAVSLAADRLRGLGGRKRILVFTDGALAQSTPLPAADADLQVITVGEPADNVAVVRIDVRAGIDTATRREQAQVFAMVRNFGERARDVFATLRIEGKPEPLASRRLLVPARDKSPVVLTFEPDPQDRGKGLTVQLSAPEGALDALAVDDTAYGRVPSGYRMPVTLATRSAHSWLARALEADPSVELQRLTLEQLATVNVDPEALVIAEGGCPEDPPGRDLVVVAPPPGMCREIEVLAAIPHPPLTSWEAGDARLRFLTLDGVHVAKATPLRVMGAEASLVRAGKETLIADASVPGRTVTLVGFDVGDSDWPLQASFVLFVRNLVEQSRVHRAQGAAGALRTGDPLRVAVPSGVEMARIEGPGLADQELTAKGGFVVLPAAERAGTYEVRWSAPRVGKTVVTANLTSEAESNVVPRPVPVDTSKGASAEGAARVAPAHREWSTWLFGLAAAVLLFDLWWLTRRPKVRRVAA